MERYQSAAQVARQARNSVLRRLDAATRVANKGVDLNTLKNQAPDVPANEPAPVRKPHQSDSSAPNYFDNVAVQAPNNIDKEPKHATIEGAPVAKQPKEETHNASVAGLITKATDEPVSTPDTNSKKSIEPEIHNASVAGLISSTPIDENSQVSSVSKDTNEDANELEDIDTDKISMIPGEAVPDTTEDDNEDLSEDNVLDPTMASQDPTVSLDEAVDIKDSFSDSFLSSFKHLPKLRAQGYSSEYKPRTAPRTSEPSFRRSPAVERIVKKTAKESFKNNDEGTHIYGKINGDRNLRLDEVAVGYEEFADCFESNNSHIVDTIQKQLEKEYPDLANKITSMSIAEIKDIIKNTNIMVSTFKPPNNDGADTQRRRLVILDDVSRGIFIHPLMSAMYTADFDGDDMSISFDKSFLYTAKSPMDYAVLFTGNTNLNEDFLPSAIIRSTENKTSKQLIKQLFPGFNNKGFSKVVDAIDNLSKASDPKYVPNLGSDLANKQAKDLNYQWTQVLYACREYSGKDNTFMEKLVRNVFNRLQSIKILTALYSIEETVPRFVPTEKMTFADDAVYKFMDGFVRGVVPNNYQDMRTMFTQFLGMRDGTNAPFRGTSDLGKQIKMDARFFHGDEFVVDLSNKNDSQEFFSNMAKYVMSQKMSHDSRTKGHYDSVMMRLRDAVITQVGFPDQYNSFRDWLQNFVHVYSVESQVARQAELSFTADMGIIDDRLSVAELNGDVDSVNIVDLAEPILQIYGSYSFARIFHQFIGTDKDTRFEQGQRKTEREFYKIGSKVFVFNKYLNMPLNRIKVDNHFISNASNFLKVAKQSYTNEKLTDAELQYLIAMSIANKRTAVMSAFNQNVYTSSKSVVSMLRESLIEMKNVNEKQKDDRDKMLFINELVDVIRCINTEIMVHFNLDTTAGFYNSRIGKKMMDHCESNEKLGGIRLALVARYQLRDIEDLSNKIDNVDLESPTAVQKIAEYNNRIQTSLNYLSTVSEVWEGIIKEQSNGRAFKELSSLDANSSSIFLNADKYWKDVRHKDIFAVLADLDMDYSEKIAVIADVVRWQLNQPYINTYDIAYQLEIGTDGPSSYKSVMRDFNDITSARYAYKNKDTYTANIRNAYEEYGSKPGYLMNTLQRLANNPWELNTIDSGLYADALLSAREKTYHQTEKSKQHPWTNLFYTAISFCKNSGFFNDIYRTDDRALGLISTNNISEEDLIKVLADQTYSITVYNDYGELVTVTQKSLLGIDTVATEDEIWNFLLTEPRLATAIRQYTTSYIGDREGSGYLGAIGTTSSAIQATNERHNPAKTVKGILRDNTVYGGIISMLTPAHNTSTRNSANRILEAEDFVAKTILKHSEHASPDNMNVGKDIAEDLGITRDALYEILESQYDKYLQVLGLNPEIEDNEYKEDSDHIYNTIVICLSRMALGIHNDSRVLDFNSKDIETSFKPSMDVQSVASFWDTVQELAGSKTHVSTGVEGRETYDMASWISSIPGHDHYADARLILDDIKKNPEKFIGCWTNYGPIAQSSNGHGTNINQLIKQANKDSSEVVVLCPDDFIVPDKSTDVYNNPIRSIMAYMVSKRANGAEKFNLKAKKTGIDLNDPNSTSIAKMHGKHGDTNYNDLLHDLRNEYGQNGLVAAQLKLAKYILEVNNKQGYKDLTLANYMNIAQLMLIVGEDGNLYLRSIEQISSAIKYRCGLKFPFLNWKHRNAEALKVINDASENGVGIVKMTALEAFDQMRVRSNADGTRALRSASSNFKRNYELMEQIKNRVSNVAPESLLKERHAIYTTQVPIERYKKVFKHKAGDIFNRCNLTRQYRVISYQDCVKTEAIKAIGPQNMVIIDVDTEAIDKQKRIEAILNIARKRGLTVLVAADSLKYVPNNLRADLIRASKDGDCIIPFFEMELNGSQGQPTKPRFAIMPVSFNRLVTSVEDSLNYYLLGDAQAMATQSFIDRLDYIDAGNQTINSLDLFANVIGSRAYDSKTDFQIALATQADLEVAMNTGFNGVTVDYGIKEGEPGFDKRKQLINKAIERWMDRQSEISDDGYILNDNKPGDIIAWAVIQPQGKYADDNPIFAPIIPFPLDGSTANIPSKFSVSDLGSLNSDSTLFSVNWYNTSEISYAKYVDSSGGANKGMLNFQRVIKSALKLLDGSPIDVFIASASTDSRKIGTDRRIKTMITLMNKARMTGYNFAELENAFPNNPDIKAALLAGPIKRSTWKKLFMESPDNMITFCNEPRMNAFINREAKKFYNNGGNPSNFLANVWNMPTPITNADGEIIGYDESNTNRVIDETIWEYEAMFDYGLNYENDLLKFFHTMMPQFCPNGVNDTSEDYLFRLYKNDYDSGENLGDNYGVLQMRVPYERDDGATVYLWQNVYIGLSFFCEDCSAFNRPNTDGAALFLDAASTMAYYGKYVNDHSEQLRHIWSTSSMASVGFGANDMIR